MVVAEVLTGLALVKQATDFIKSNLDTAKDIGSLAGQIDDLLRGEGEAQKARSKKSGQSLTDQFGVENVAREVIDAKLAQEKVREIATLIDLRFGHGTWRGILDERARRIQAQKERAKQEALEKAAQRKEIFDGLSMLFYLIMGVLVVGLIALVAFKASASIPKMTTCRLAHTEVISKKEILCFYQGANNTQESHTTELHVGCARSYQCEYNPRPSGYSLKGTLDSIKDALK